MDDTVEKSYLYDTSSGPVLETHPRQTNLNYDEPHSQDSQQPRIRHRKEKKDDNNDSIMEYGEEQDNRALYQPILWWFTSTAFPLIAGTFGPIASLFSICALLKTWRVSTINGSHVPDPPWLITLNSCSLFLAFVANFILSFNFARRIRYALAQPLTISLWYLSCVTLVIPIGLTRLPRFSPSTNPTLEYSESFYYAVISATLYFIISTLLLLNFIGASRLFRAYPPSFAVLTHSQRTLMLQTISFSFYLALGAAIFAAIEGWSFTEGLYWADYTVLTIGLGTDFPLKTTLGRMLLIPYAPFGIAMVGLLVNSVMGLVMERAKEKVAIRHLGKERDRWTDHISKRLQGEDEKEGLRLIAPRPRSLLFCWHYKEDKKFQQLPRVIAGARSAQHKDRHAMWHHAEFELMRYIQITSEQSERYFALVVSFFAFLIVWIGGSLVFWATEHKIQQWTYVESLYFTYTTLLTIGYGDFFPVSAAGRPFFVVWSLIAVPTMTVLIGNMGDTVVRTVQEVTDWTGRKTRVLPEYQHERLKKNEREPGEVEKDQASSDSNRTRECPLASPAPSFSAGRTSPIRSYVGPSSISPSGEGQESPVVSQLRVESPLETRDEEQHASDPSASQNPQQSKGESSPSQVHAEAMLLAREISKLAKDACQQPPKKYGWEEWVNWLKVLGDEAWVAGGVKEMELEIEASMNIPETSANNLDPHLHHVDHQRRPDKHHRRYHSQPNPHLQLDADGAGWNWTWLDDRGPLFSPETETEWILSRLCSRLEHLMSDYSHTT